MSIITEPIIGYRMWRTPFSDSIFPQGVIFHHGVNQLRSIYHKSYVLFSAQLTRAVEEYQPCKTMIAKCYCAGWNKEGRMYFLNHKDIPECNPIADNIRVTAERSCGIYAFKNINDLINDHFSYVYSDCIVGEVALWGKIQEHKDGFRAQFAYPKAFFVYNKLDRSILQEFANAWLVDLKELSPEFTDSCQFDCKP